MSRQIPYVFCRYRLRVSRQELDPNGQYQFLREMQGRLFPHGSPRNNKPQPRALIMQPTAGQIEGETYLVWSVGIQQGFRAQNQYDRDTMELVQHLIPDPHVKYAPIWALPERSVMAIEDRSLDDRISAKQAISALRSIVYAAYDRETSFEVRHGDPDDIHRWLDEWELTEFSYTISPLNPVTAGDLRKCGRKQ